MGVPKTHGHTLPVEHNDVIGVRMLDYPDAPMLIDLTPEYATDLAPRRVVGM